VTHATHEAIPRTDVAMWLVGASLLAASLMVIAATVSRPSPVRTAPAPQPSAPAGTVETTLLEA
jgi:hypothetical protein